MQLLCVVLCLWLRWRAGVELQLNEWNNANAVEQRGTLIAATAAANVLCTLQNEPVDLLCYYDARIGQSRYGGMFNPITYQPFPLYYSFLAFGELYRLGTQYACDLEGWSCVAASDGEKRAIMLVNSGGRDVEVESALGDGWEAYVLDETHNLEKVELDPKKFVLGKYSVVLLKYGY